MNFSRSILLILMALPVVTKAITIRNSMDSELKLGYGVDPLTETGYEKCIEYDSVEALDGTSNKDGDAVSLFDRFTVKEVTSYEELNSFSSTSMGASFSYMAYSGSFSYDETREHKRFSDRAMVMLDSSADYGRWTLTNVRLKPEMKLLLKEDPESFFRRCGREYVDGYRLGQGLHVLMSSSAEMVYSYSRIQQSVSAAVNTGAASGGFAASFLDTSSELLKLGSLQVHLTSYGGNGLPSLHEFVSTEADAKKFRERLATYMNTLKTSSAVRTHFITKAYPGTANLYDRTEMEYRRSTLESLYQDYLYVADNLERFRTFSRKRLQRQLGKLCAYSGTLSCEDYVQRLDELRSQLRESIKDIEMAASACMSDNDIRQCRGLSSKALQIDTLQRFHWPQQYRYLLYLDYLEQIRDRK